VKRLGLESESQLPELEDEDSVWQMIAFYLAQACANISLLTSVQKIVIGGGVMQRKVIMNLLHQEFIMQMNGYVQHPLLTEKVEEYIVASELENNSTLAALLL